MAKNIRSIYENMKEGVLIAVVGLGHLDSLLEKTADLSPERIILE